MKVAELSDASLDYWVGKATGADVYIIKHGPDGDMQSCYMKVDVGNDCLFNPRINWSLLGPLIDKYNINLESNAYDGLRGAYRDEDVDDEGNNKAGMLGETYLIAACRCIVASVFGEELPEQEDR